MGMLARIVFIEIDGKTSRTLSAYADPRHSMWLIRPGHIIRILGSHHCEEVIKFVFI
jgi:hypothetical protein